MNFSTLFLIALGLMPTHQWRLINNRHWQAISGNKIVPPLPSDHCTDGMVHIKGNMKQDPNPNPYGSGTIEFLQKTVCENWINRSYPERCQSFNKDKWLAISQNFTTKPMDFCIDRYEYPNQAGQYPMIMVNYNEAENICKQESKRLCTETEWTFACEGEEATPYPYGYDRNTATCVIDKPFRAFNEKNMLPRNTEKAMLEMDHLWQGETSGSRPNCKSPFGVMDMTGNVDEITTAVKPSKYKLALKGGAWTGVRNRCQPATRSHNLDFIFYQESFRCCSNVK